MNAMKYWKILQYMGTWARNRLSLFNPFTTEVEKLLIMLLKFCGVNTARFSSYVWLFFLISCMKVLILVAVVIFGDF